jgi:hypothetical protein
VRLSPNRFRHLFVEETGMPLRTCQLGRRLLHAWEFLVRGESLAGAAHASRLRGLGAPHAHLPHHVRARALGDADERAAERADARHAVKPVRRQ